MYYYLYDTFLADSKFEKIIDRIKTRLLDLEIQGKHEKLTLLKSIDELINDETKRGISTIVVIGNDRTFLKVVDAAAKNNLTLGLIPVGEDNNIARSFGLAEVEAACDVIAARKIVRFDLGKIGSQYFFSNLKITKNLDRLQIQKDAYAMIPRPDCASVEVYNFYFPRGERAFEQKLARVNGQDQMIELVIKKKVRKGSWLRRKTGERIDTIIQSKIFDIKSFEYLPVVLDDFKIIKTPVRVEVEPLKLKIIAGKERRPEIK